MDKMVLWSTRHSALLPWWAPPTIPESCSRLELLFKISKSKSFEPRALYVALSTMGTEDLLLSFGNLNPLKKINSNSNDEDKLLSDSDKRAPTGRRGLGRFLQRFN